MCSSITACTVVQYKLLYKPWALSMGEGDFRSSTAPRSLNRLSWNLKYITTFRTRPRTQNFRGLCRRGWSGQIASLTHESFSPYFFISSSRPQVASLDISPRTIRHSRQGSAFWGLEGWNLKFDPFTLKNVKIGTLSWRSMENFNRPNCGTVSLIQFKLGTGIEHPSASRDMTHLIFAVFSVGLYNIG